MLDSNWMDELAKILGYSQDTKTGQDMLSGLIKGAAGSSLGTAAMTGSKTVGGKAKSIADVATEGRVQEENEFGPKSMANDIGGGMGGGGGGGGMMSNILSSAGSGSEGGGGFNFGQLGQLFGGGAGAGAGAGGEAAAGAGGGGAAGAGGGWAIFLKLLMSPHARMNAEKARQATTLGDMWG